MCEVPGHWLGKRSGEHEPFLQDTNRHGRPAPSRARTTTAGSGRLSSRPALGPANLRGGGQAPVSAFPPPSDPRNDPAGGALGVNAPTRRLRAAKARAGQFCFTLHLSSGRFCSKPPSSAISWADTGTPPPLPPPGGGARRPPLPHTAHAPRPGTGAVTPAGPRACVEAFGGAEAVDWEEAVGQRDREPLRLRLGGDGEAPGGARRPYGALRIRPR